MALTLPNAFPVTPPLLLKFHFLLLTAGFLSVVA
ncbi:hypothetical protein X279_06270 [Oenococcus oeni IOEB_0501]|nr:hypothetical protein X279_06270 [Oenococcus oeni IOEB_0501]